MKRQAIRIALAAIMIAAGSQSKGAVLTGSLAAENANANLSSEGTEDWAVWGYADGGTSTSLTPDVRKAGGSAISDLTDIDPPPPLALRGIGQFSSVIPFLFSWTNGSTVPSASEVTAGLQNFAPGAPFVPQNGYGFSFSVPAGPETQTMEVYVSAHHCSGLLTATLSDGSAPEFIDTGLTGGFNSPGIYTLEFASATPDQTLNVSWTEFSPNADSANVLRSCVGARTSKRDSASRRLGHNRVRDPSPPDSVERQRRLTVSTALARIDAAALFSSRRPLNLLTSGD